MARRTRAGAKVPSSLSQEAVIELGRLDAAGIRSQRHEGWSLLPASYDDGGLSGGSLNRPALQRLLTDLASGRVDLVVVYKVDRLTRSLADFAKIVEVFDAHGASFVSVTQHFNTTTSMGRLTLNMLLSFAQFEREVTGERIRDKIAASKRKGMWMGGSVAFGYEVRDRKLIVNAEQAELVRRTYQLYLDFGSVRLVQHQLAAEGITGKDGRAFGRGALFHLLQNRLYRGQVAHKGNIYPGEHEAIVDPELWEMVQARLAEARADRRAGGQASQPSLLAGMLSDAVGGLMVATHATKSDRRYRYYVSSVLITGTREEHADALRLPAVALEKVVLERVGRLLSDGPAMLQVLRSAEALPPQGGEQRSILGAAAALSGRWLNMGHTLQRDFLSSITAEIAVQRHEVAIRISARRLVAKLTGRAHEELATSHRPIEDDITLTEPVALRRAGREMALLVGSTIAADRSDPSLVRLVAKAWALRNELVASTAPSLTAFAQQQGISQSYASRLVRLAWLAPDIVESILDGRQPKGLTASSLMRDTRIPIDWQDQRRALGFAQ
ncbi:recombinase family protein [Roseococcus sp.]|uniref:recombinase family protein n=1 Tax=Roseococcus sp. TaxID=2109646 RepID=UPI003BABD2FD